MNKERFERYRLITLIERYNPVATLQSETEEGDFIYTSKIESTGDIVFFLVPYKETFLGKRRERMLSQEWSKSIVRFLKVK